MKKIIYTLGIIAASAAAFTACQKEQATNDDVLPDGKLVTISFTAEKAGLETKTAAVEGETSVSYIWTDDDIANIKLFTVTDGSITGEVDSPTVTKVSDTQLTISATVAANATYTFRAILCDPASYTGSGDDYTSRKPKIKTSQSPNGTSNFDSTADILVSDDKEVTVGEDETTTGDMLLSFRRQVVVNKMTLKNLVEGEKISKVIVKSDKHLTGYLNNGSMEGQAKELSLNYDNVAVPASGQFVVYFITMENTGQTLTVEVTTNQNTYSKTFGSTIDFNLGQFTKFGVSLPAGTPLVDYSGTYALGSADGTKIAKAYASGSNIPAADASLEGSVLYYDPDVVTIADAQITLSRIVDSESTYYGMYTIVQNGLYLYAASNSANQLKAKDYLVDEVVVLDADAYWSVSCTDGNWAISADKSSNRNVLRFNSTLFSCYASTSSGTAFALYPIANVKPTPVITADASIELSSDAVSSSTSTGATFNSNTSTVTAGAYSDAECTAASSWLTVSTSGSGSSTVVNYTATANDTGSERTAYIKITATNSDSHSVNTVIKVTQAAAGDTKLELTFDLTSNPGGWPTANSTTLTDYTYTLNEVNYTFKLYNTKQNSGYLMLSSVAGLGLPAISGYKLTKVVANNSSGCSTSTKVGISSTAPTTATYVTGGAIQTWSTTSSSYTYTLSSTAANTVYYLYVTNKNCQITGLKLTYEAVD